MHIQQAHLRLRFSHDAACIMSLLPSCRKLISERDTNTLINQLNDLSLHITDTKLVCDLVCFITYLLIIFSEKIRRFRDYYFQAEEVLWDYLPTGENLVDNNNE